MYKGDMIAAEILLVYVGVILLLFAFYSLPITTCQPIYKFLSYSFIMFFLYSIMKRTLIYYIYSEKYKFFHNKTVMTLTIQKKEILYTEYRIAKKY